MKKLKPEHQENTERLNLLQQVPAGYLLIGTMLGAEYRKSMEKNGEATQGLLHASPVVPEQYEALLRGEAGEHLSGRKLFTAKFSASLPGEEPAYPFSLEGEKQSRDISR